MGMEEKMNKITNTINFINRINDEIEKYSKKLLEVENQGNLFLFNRIEKEIESLEIKKISLQQNLDLLYSVIPNGLKKVVKLSIKF